MNRKERRAQRSAGPAAALPRAPSPQAAAAAPLLVEASRYQQQGNFDKAVTLYKRALAVKPDDAQALNNLAIALLALGRREEAAARFARTLALVPELVEQYRDVCAALVSVNPTLGEAMRRAAASSAPMTMVELLGPSGLAGICRDPLLRAMLEAATVRDVDLERVLTVVRAALLTAAAASVVSDRVDDDMLAFCCALARQCYINEYVFAEAPVETEQVARLRQSLNNALASGGPVPLHWIAAFASYCPLGALETADALLERTWPAAVWDLLTQQVREPREEQELRSSIPRLTPIEDDVSVSVRQQYEENPYPRWVNLPSRRAPVTIDAYLRAQFPAAPFRALGKSTDVDMLLAGCGTGIHAMLAGQRYAGVRLLAIDLSLASLCYALRKTRAASVSNIDYAQADILQLGSVGRTFDVIDAGGVLHHLADPMQGWRVLLSLLRPGGFMRLGFYSALGRRDVLAARTYIAEQGFRSTAEDIRRCRQRLLATPHRAVAKYYDYFSTSECRDLLFHVQEHVIGIPDIRSFMVAHTLQFIGFEVAPQVYGLYRERFPADHAMTDLDHWHAFETAHPDTFAGMYQFWVQKS
jgi:SAM-dependent methyltransferase